MLPTDRAVPKRSKKRFRFWHICTFLRVYIYSKSRKRRSQTTFNLLPIRSRVVRVLSLSQTGYVLLLHCFDRSPGVSTKSCFMQIFRHNFSFLARARRSRNLETSRKKKRFFFFWFVRFRDFLEFVFASF